MPSLASHPSIIRLARDLHLSTGGDCLETITNAALARIAEIIRTSPVAIQSLSDLQQLVANALSVTLCFLDSDSQLQEIAADHGHACPGLYKLLEEEFLVRGTEGILLARPFREAWECVYLAVIDRRGEEANRANFTAWHELAHVLTTPEQLTFAGFRRTPTELEIKKDPIEQLTDHLAGLLAFYQPVFAPAFSRYIGREPVLFSDVEQVRIAAAPEASLLSTAMACTRLSTHPTLLMTLEYRYRAADQRALRLPQLGLNFSSGNVERPPDLRVALCSPNPAAQGSNMKIFKQMRVPHCSVLFEVCNAVGEEERTAVEDQSWWETSQAGALPSLPIFVRGVRRGSFVYGMISPAV